MKKILFLIAPLIIGLASCDGRTSMKKSLTQSVEDYQKANLIIKTEYHPVDYREFESDTILSNGYRVKISNYTNMQKSILKEKLSGIELAKNYYREINSKITISHKESIIFSKIIDFNYLRNRLEQLEKNSEPYELRSISVNQYESIITNSIILNIDYSDMNSKQQTFKVRITENGDIDYIST